MVWGLAALAAEALAAPLNAMGGAQPEGTASLSPSAFAGVDGWAMPQLYGAVGARDADLNVGFMGDFVPGWADTAILDVFPRFFATPTLAVVPRLIAPIGGRPAVGLELHHAWEWGRWFVTTNAGWSVDVGGSKRANGATFAMVAPEFVVSDRLSVYVEVNPTLALDGRSFELTLVPGFAANLDEAANHQLCFGAQFPVAPAPALPTVGAWYSWSFNLGDG